MAMEELLLERGWQSVSAWCKSTWLPVFLLLCMQEAPWLHIHLLINHLLLPSAVHYHFVGIDGVQ